MSRLRIYSLVLLACAALALVPVPALAQDGVTLIDQNTAGQPAVGCPIGYQPHTGFPITICQSGSYKLASNLNVNLGNLDAINIMVDNVTIDLNGYTISGPGVAGTGVGIRSTYKRITISNGTVTKMGGDGIRLTALNGGSIVERVGSLNNRGAGIVVYDGTVTRSTASGNSGDGIQTNNGNTGTTVSLNTVTGNGGYGIYLGALVSNNTISLNGKDGVYQGLTVVGNAIFFNTGFGLNNFFGTGYGQNVFYVNTAGSVTGGGVSMSNSNVCNGLAC